MRFTTILFAVLAIIVLITACKQNEPSGPRPLEILFLGHDSEHHNSSAYLPMLTAQLAKEGIHFTYTDDPASLNADNLALFDGLMIYANHDSITQDQENALIDFVKNGKGFIPIHCASFCFRNSEEYISMVGGQFLSHKMDSFQTKIIRPEHPALDSVSEFAAWDETYVHHKLAKDITVLMERVEGDHHEPWTWVKDYGKGRVFYTASGHDERVWNKPGFHQLVKQGILWAVGDKAKADWEEFHKSLPELVYEEQPNIPNYEKRDPAPKYQMPLSPEESKKTIQVPPGFDLQLFASEPDIINPIAMEWDEKGRLWVIETVDYPNTVLEDPAGDDRIKICEDTDNDGKADKFTIFADKLNIPTSIVFANGGVIISQAPEFIFLKDTDGDDKADSRQVIIQGWGVTDTHAGPSSLKYGFDNQIWGVLGYSGFEGQIAGEQRQFRQGLYRFKPDVSSFEFMTNTSNNTWGLGFTEDNNIFASTANNTHSVFMGIPNKITGLSQDVGVPGSTKIDGHYAMHPNTDKVRQVDVFGGFTAAAGHNFYTARAFPEEYWNKIAFVSEPTGHLVHMAKIEKDGAGFIEKDHWNLFASSDEWVSPVDAKTGPDGAVWLLDWYNFIIQHNPTPTPERGGYQAVTGTGNAYENPLRDRSHGRIWRVVYKKAKKYDPIRLSKDDERGLIDALSNDNMFWRLTAQRLLVERGNPDIFPELYNLIIDDGNDLAIVHALWTIDGLNIIHKEDKALQVVTASLKHKSPAVRKAAIEILSKGHWSEEIVNSNNLLDDPDPNTRLAAILSLTRLSPSLEIGERLYSLSTDESVKKDEWLSKAVYLAGQHHGEGFMAAFGKANPGFDPAASLVESKAAPDLNVSAWKEMEVPGTIEKAGLNIDGIVWLRKTVDLGRNVSGKATLSLARIDDADVTYVNGVHVGQIEGYNIRRNYEIPAGVLKPGKNVIAVKLQDNSGQGGILGNPEDVFIQVGDKKTSVTGLWKYQVEKEFSNRPASMFADTPIGEHLAKSLARRNAKQASSATVSEDGATVIRIKVIKNAMKYDLKTFTVEAGKPVIIEFENPDFMQHNLVIGKSGSLQVIGKAADKLASAPNGAEMNYVPKIPEVLFFTKLINPQESVKLTFTAPSTEGDYPYVCTFPGHWSVMNGVMKVVGKK